MEYTLTGDSNNYLYQWDTKRFVVSDADSIEWVYDEEPTLRRVLAVDGRVEVPNDLLQTAKSIVGYMDGVDDDGALTHQKITIKVIAREQPTDYIYTPTEIQTVQSMIDASVLVETERAEAAESANADAISAETTRATKAESNVLNTLATETARAKAAENTNAVAVKTETNRAKAVEEENTSAITEEIAARKQTDSNLTAEIARAKAAESANAKSISDEVTRAKAAEYTTSTNLSSEITRAKAVESTLLNKFSSYSLLVDAGHTIDLTLDTTTYKMKAVLSNKSGTVISESSEIDLPIESLIMNVEYDKDKKAIIITLQDGTKKEVPVADLVSGLVSETEFDEEVERAKAAEPYIAIIGTTTYAEAEAARLAGKYITAQYEPNNGTFVLTGISTKNKTLTFTLIQGQYSYSTILSESGWSEETSFVSADNSKLSIADNSSGGVNVKIKGTTKTLAKQTDLAAKQDAISDLDTIRSGAAAGATALQSVPDTYRTSAAQDEIDTEIKSALSAKLDKPSDTPVVGKILRVKSVNDDGSFVCEWADDADSVTDVQVNGTSVLKDGVANVPLGTTDSTGYGVVRGASGYGTNIVSGTMRTSCASTSDIDSRTSNYMPIVPQKLDYAVKAALTDGKGAAYSDTEKIAAQTRLGINKYELIEKIDITSDTLTAITRTAEPDGTPYSFKEIDVVMYTPAATGTVSIQYQLTIDGNAINNYIGGALSTSARMSGVFYDGKDVGRYPAATGAIARSIIVTDSTTFMICGGIVTGLYIKPSSSVVAIPSGSWIVIRGIRA